MKNFILTITLLSSYCFNAQELVRYEKYDSFSLLTYADKGYDHTHNFKGYTFLENKDSILSADFNGYFNAKTDKITRNGKAIFYSSKGTTTKYYILDEEHGDDPENIGAGKFYGWKIKKIPLFEYKTIDKKSKNNEIFRLSAEERLVKKPTKENGYTYNSYKNEILAYDIAQYKSPYMNWWWPNLLDTKDKNHNLVDGIDFTLDFTPKKSDDAMPITIMLGNGPDGYYYLKIDSAGTTYLGESTKSGNRNVLYVSKATKITWGQKNHLRLQVLENGNYYIEINDFKESLENISYENQMAKDTIFKPALSSMFGGSNRIQAATEIKIHYIALQQIELLNTKKKTHPYNGMHKDHLHYLTKKIIETMFKQTDDQKLKDVDIYLTGFKGGTYSDNVLGVMCEVLFYNKLENKETSRPMLIEYILEPKTNAIKEIKMYFDTQNHFTFTPQKLFSDVFNEDKSSGYWLQDGLLHHPNSRTLENQ